MVETFAGLNNSLTRPMENIRCFIDDTKPSLKFILGFDYTAQYIRKKKICATCRFLWPNFGSCQSRILLITAAGVIQ